MSIGIDRYCKHAIYQAFEDIHRLLILSALDKRFEQCNTVACTQIPVFENVPYLRRFRADGNVYVTALVVQLSLGVGATKHLLLVTVPQSCPSKRFDFPWTPCC